MSYTSTIVKDLSLIPAGIYLFGKDCNVYKWPARTTETVSCYVSECGMEGEPLGPNEVMLYFIETGAKKFWYSFAIPVEKIYDAKFIDDMVGAARAAV